MSTEYDALARRIDAGFAHDERIRALETGMAKVETVIADFPRFEARLMAAIEANAPKSPWPAVSAIAGLVGVGLVVAAALFGVR